MRQILSKIRDNYSLQANGGNRKAHGENIELKSRIAVDLEALHGFSFEEIPASATASSSADTEVENVYGSCEQATDDRSTYGSRYFHECPRILKASKTCEKCDDFDDANLYTSCLGTVNLRRNSDSGDDILRRTVIPTTPEMTGVRKIIQQKQQTTSRAPVEVKFEHLFSQDVIDTALGDNQADIELQDIVFSMKDCQESVDTDSQEDADTKHHFGGIISGEIYSPKLTTKRKYSKKRKTKNRFFDNKMTRERKLSLIDEADENLELTSSSTEGSTTSVQVDSEEPESLVDDLDDPMYQCSVDESANSEENIRNTLIHKVVTSGDITMLESLIEQGCTDLNEEDHQGWPPLLQAVKKGNILCAKTLLKNKAKLNFVNKGTGNCLLHNLVEEGNYEGVEFLLEHGANPNLLNQQGWPPLHVALQAHQFKCAALLIRAGTDVTYYTHKRIEEYCKVIEMANGFQQLWLLEI